MVNPALIAECIYCDLHHLIVHGYGSVKKKQRENILHRFPHGGASYD